MDLLQSIENNFPKIESYFYVKSMNLFLQAQPYELEQFNVGLGTIIRLKLLNPKNALYKQFKANGVTNKDEMSMEIIKRFHRHMTQPK